MESFNCKKLEKQERKFGCCPQQNSHSLFTPFYPFLAVVSLLLFCSGNGVTSHHHFFFFFRSKLPHLVVFLHAHIYRQRHVRPTSSARVRLRETAGVWSGTGCAIRAVLVPRPRGVCPQLPNTQKNGPHRHCTDPLTPGAVGPTPMKISTVESPESCHWPGAHMIDRMPPVLLS